VVAGLSERSARPAGRVVATKKCVVGLPDKCVPEARMIAEEGTAELAARDLAILAFERRWWRFAGAKEEAIRRELGLSPTAYYQLLDRLLDDPSALRAEPVLIDRLRRLRATRDRRRAGAGRGDSR
jgi:hypothetical protein